MRMSIHLGFFSGMALAMGAALLTACGGEGNGNDEQPASVEPVVMTTFYPTTYFAERITGGVVPVELPLPDGEDPIFWQPSPETIARYQRAAAIVINGAGFEKWVATASLPRSRVINTAAGFRDRFIEMETVTHSHGPAGEHTHTGIDGHTWVDPNNAILQANAIAEGLADAFPERIEMFEANLPPLRADLEALDGRLRDVTAKLEGVVLLASHPAYNYLAQRYGWEIENLDLDPRAELTDVVLADIDRAIQARGYEAPVILLWESAPLETTTEQLKTDLGITSVLFSPAETRSDEQRDAGEDYLSIMNSNVDRLNEALSES